MTFCHTEAVRIATAGVIDRLGPKKEARGEERQEGTAARRSPHPGAGTAASRSPRTSSEPHADEAAPLVAFGLKTLEPLDGLLQVAGLDESIELHTDRLGHGFVEPGHHRFA